MAEPAVPDDASQPLADDLAERRRHSWVRLAAGITALVALNIVAYWVFGLPPVQDFFAGLEGSAYAGSFFLALVTNLTVAVPIPYNPIILQMMEASSQPWLIAFTTALGATIGETSGYLAGRAGRGSFEGTRFSTWVGRQLAHPVRAFVVLFAVSAPPFPAFDVAGLLSGALGVSPRVFYPAVFLGRFTRFLVFAAYATWIST
jgi:membrane protein YqaA with SNARE-associated domain